MHAKSYEHSAMSIYSVVKLNLSRLSVCKHSALSKWYQMTSALHGFFDVMAHYLHFTKIEMQSLCGQQTFINVLFVLAPL